MCVPAESNYLAHLSDLISPPFVFFKTDHNFSTDVKYLHFYDDCDLVLHRE